MSMVQIQIAGNTYNSQSVGFKDVLKQAYEGRERPLCLCTAKRPELYIAKINDGYFLKRMPGTGIEHDAECPHFELSPLLSGRGNLEASAITHDLTSNTTLLKLGFPLSTHIGYSRGAPPPGSNKATQEVASAPDRKLNLRSLLDLIYEDAHLNR